jgi:hypothetical protein
MLLLTFANPVTVTLPEAVTPDTFKIPVLTVPVNVPVSVEIDVELIDVLTDVLPSVNLTDALSNVNVLTPPFEKLFEPNETNVFVCSGDLASTYVLIANDVTSSAFDPVVPAATPKCVRLANVDMLEILTDSLSIPTVSPFDFQLLTKLFPFTITTAFAVSVPGTLVLDWCSHK